jgi:hypothetical protein
MNTRSYGAEKTGMDGSTVFQISAYLSESDDLRNEIECYLDSGVPIGSFPYDFESRELAEQFAKGLPKGGKSLPRQFEPVLLGRMST